MTKKLTSKDIADQAIAIAEQATWASNEMKITIAFGECAKPIYWCDNTKIEHYAILVSAALDYVMMHFAPAGN
jgi:hypothetical protein